MWDEWTIYRGDYLKQNLGILVSVQRKHLRNYLDNFMTQNTTYTASSIKSWGLEAKQLKLYEYCKDQ